MADRAVNELKKLLGNEAAEEEVEALVRMYSRVSRSIYIGDQFQSGALELSEEEFERMERTLLHPLEELNIALVVVDFQNDFIDGSLGIKVNLK